MMREAPVFWAAEVDSKSPHVENIDEDAVELTIANVAFASATPSGKGPYALKIKVDDHPAFTLCTLTPGKDDHRLLEILLGPGNDKFELSLEGKGSDKVHVTGYYSMPYGDMDVFACRVHRNSSIYLIRRNGQLP